MKLVIVHNHFRPGGVRRVIELATPYLARALRPRVREIVLVAGELPDEAWWRSFRAQLAPLPVSSQLDPAVGYLAEQRLQPRTLAARLRAFLDQLLPATGADCLVWAHNQGLGRNLLLTRALWQACDARRIPLVFHHHDWWFDNRWARWPEMRRAGFHTLAEVAATVFAGSANIRHVAINRSDAGILEEHFPGQAGWLPNPAESAPPPSAAHVRATRAWLRKQLGEKSPMRAETAPVWLMPCRLLRRKNIAEALLLTRWLRPEAWLITTGNVTSAEERPYADRLATAAHKHGWRLKLAIMQGSEATKPALPELFAASEAVLLTSLLEGFGLPYLEAAAAGKPLLARALPNVAPDLAQFGFSFPQYYDEILVAPDLFDWDAELKHQAHLFKRWRQRLPRACHGAIGLPLLVSGCPAQPVPFSRLSLTAQLQVLAQPVERSWQKCAPLNPFLRVWHDLAERGALRKTSWPRGASRWLSGPAFARQFKAILEGRAPQPSLPPEARARVRESLSLSPTWGEGQGEGAPFNNKCAANQTAQAQFIQRKLAAANLYPLLMSPRT